MKAQIMDMIFKDFLDSKALEQSREIALLQSKLHNEATKNRILSKQLNQQRAKESETASVFARLNASHAETIAELRQELQRLNTQLSPPKPINKGFSIDFGLVTQTVYGMTLDEVRGLKAERDELKAKLRESQASRGLDHLASNKLKDVETENSYLRQRVSDCNTKLVQIRNIIAG